MNNMQQSIGDPPDVSGWKAYYQEPQFYEIWINSDTLPKRNQFTDTMVMNGFTFAGKRMIIDGAEFAKTLPNPGDPNQLINDFTKLIPVIIGATGWLQHRDQNKFSFYSW